MPKIIHSTTMRNHLADTLKEISKKEDYLLVVKKNKPIGALVNIDFFEDLLAASSSKYLKSIKKAREDYKKKRIFTHQEVFGEI